MNKIKYLSIPALLLAGQSAMATTVADAAVTEISTNGTAAITAVGGALIGLAALAVVFKWVKGSIFG